MNQLSIFIIIIYFKRKNQESPKTKFIDPIYLFWNFPLSIGKNLKRTVFTTEKYEFKIYKFDHLYPPASIFCQI